MVSSRDLYLTGGYKAEADLAFLNIFLNKTEQKKALGQYQNLDAILIGKNLNIYCMTTKSSLKIQ